MNKNGRMGNKWKTLGIEDGHTVESRLYALVFLMLFVRGWAGLCWLGLIIGGEVYPEGGISGRDTSWRGLSRGDISREGISGGDISRGGMSGEIYPGEVYPGATTSKLTFPLNCAYKNNEKKWITATK